MDLKPGSRWKSAVCDGEFVVVRPPKSAVILECGGHPVIRSHPHGRIDPESGMTRPPTHRWEGNRCASASEAASLAARAGTGGVHRGIRMDGAEQST